MIYSKYVMNIKKNIIWQKFLSIWCQKPKFNYLDIKDFVDRIGLLQYVLKNKKI